MNVDVAERIYSVVGIGSVIVAFVVMFWFHRDFYSHALVDNPESLSEGQLRRILSWGRLIHRLNAQHTKAEEIMHRMELALAELRKRRA